MRYFKMGALGTRPSFSGLEAWVSGCGFAQLPNHLTTEPPNQRLGTDPKFPVCVTLPRRSIVRERAGSAASAKRQGRCDGCIFMAGIISKNQSARQERSCPSLAPTRMRREDMHLDNAGEFHSNTVAVPDCSDCSSLQRSRKRRESTEIWKYRGETQGLSPIVP